MYVHLGCDGRWEGEGLVNGSALCAAGFEVTPYLAFVEVRVHKPTQ
jgi:hypothetical protein